MSEMSPDPRQCLLYMVATVERSRAMFAFLRSIDLMPLEWSKIVKATDKTNPYIGEVLAQGFRMAQAAVVLATPDDEARLKKEFWQDADGDNEREFNGQARQNVIFEAGMALGLHEDRTVIVELGQIRAMSDTLGRYVVRLGNSTEARQALVQRLEVAGCAVCMDGTDWQSEGDFEATIAGDVTPDTNDRAEAITASTTPVTESPVDKVNTHRSLSAADYVNLGEHLWYLSNPPRAPVDSVVTAVRNFLDKLDSCEMPETRRAAGQLGNLILNYNLRTNVITDASISHLMVMMAPIRSTLEGEARKKAIAVTKG